MPRIFIAASAALHILLVLWVEVRGVATSHPTVVVDSWTGRGIEVDSVVGENAPLAAADVPLAAADPPPPDAPAPPLAGQRAAAADRTVIAERAFAVTSTPGAALVKARLRATPERRASATSSPPASTVASPGGTFGAEGLPTGVRHLPKAFTRALGLASRGDPRWLALPVGPVGEARFRLSVDEEGRLGELEYDEHTLATRPSPVLEHLLENTRLLLLAGRFSLDPKEVRAGAQRLRVRVEISDAGASDPTGDPNGLSELEYEPPVGSKPGRGSFRLNSGRRVIGWVYVQ